MRLLAKRRKNIRTKLASVFAISLAVLLATYAVGVYGLLRQALYRELDRQLESDFKVGEEMLENATRSGGRLRFEPVPPVDQAPDAPPGRHWRWLEIWTPDNQLLYGNPEDPTLARQLPTVPPPRAMRPVSVSFSDGASVRVLSRPLVVLGMPVVIRVLRSEEGLRHELWEYSRVLLIALPLGVVLAGLCGYVLTKPALAPLVSMAQRAKLITADRLSDRLPVDNPDDEVGQLATIFNDTLSRLERSFDRLRRFTADASHELRTPLTALRSVGEVGLRENREPAEYREIIGSLLEETDRLSGVVENLLTLSRADSGQVRLTLERLDLTEFCREIIDFLAVLAEEKRQTVHLTSSGPLPIVSDRFHLRHVIVNLLDNAVKYSPEGATVTVTIEQLGGMAAVSIIDNGPGIPAGELGRIFDRFYRIDPARTRSRGGSGLGLSIAQAGIEACGGRIEVESRMGVGSTFRILVPALAPAADATAVRAATVDPAAVK